MKTIQDRIRQRLLDLRMEQGELARLTERSPRTVEGWMQGRTQRIPADWIAKAAEILQVDTSWLLSGSPGGHGVVRESRVEYDPRPDPEATPAEQLIAFLGVRVGMRRLAGELTGKDLVAAAYTLARAERFSAEEFKKLDAWRDEILADEGRRGG